MADIKVRMNLNNGEYIDIDKRNGLKSVESLSQSTGQPKDIVYGSIASSSRLEIIDIKGEVANMLTSGVIQNSNILTDIFANGGKVQSHTSIDSEYNLNLKLFSIESQDELKDWDNLMFEGLNYSNTSSTLYHILETVMSSINKLDEVEDMTSEIIYTNSGAKSIKEYLTEIIIEYPYLEADTIRNTIDKICQVGQLNILKNNENKIKFVSARPRLTHNENIIVIPQRSQLSEFNADFILKNKVDNVIINTYKYDYKEGTFGDLQSITFNDFSNGDWEEKTSEIPQKYNYTQTTIENNDYTQAWYGEIRVEFNDDFIYSKNHILKYTPTLYKYTDERPVQLVPDNTSSIIYIELPQPSTRPSNFKPLLGDRYNPKVYTEYDDYRKKVIVHLSMWVGGAIGDYVDGSREYYYLANLSLELLSDNLETTSDTENYGTGTNKYEFSTNNLLMQPYNDISSNFAENILEDYKNGLKTASTTILCSDYYDINGNKIKNWSKGEIINVGDIIRVDKDNIGNSLIKDNHGSDMYFQITSRNFRYNGVPLLDLELRQIKPLDKYKIIIPEDTNNIINIKVVDANTGVIYKNGDEVEEGTKIIVNVEQANIHNPIRVNHIYYKDTSDLQSYAVEISNGETILIKSDIKFIIDYSFAVVYFSPENDWDGYGIYVTESDIIDNHLSIFSTYNPFGYDLYNEVSIVIREGSSTFGSTDATFSADMLNNIGNNFVSGIFDVDGYLFNIQINKTNCIIDSTKYSNLIGKLIVVEYYYWRSVIIGF